MTQNSFVRQIELTHLVGRSAVVRMVLHRQLAKARTDHIVGIQR
jgi:hypothetical protein